MTLKCEDFPTGPTRYFGIGLETAAFEQLLSCGRCEAEALRYELYGWCDEKSARHWTVAYLQTSYEYLWEDDLKGATLDRLLADAYLTELDLTGTPALILRDARPLLHLLPKVANHRPPDCPQVLLDELEKVDPEMFFEAETRAQLMKEGNFSGRVYICGCDIAGCGSQYAWFRNDVCLFYLNMASAGTWFIELFPFRLKRV
jgi:hypothetical protein